MDKIVVDCRTGRSQSVPLTDADQSVLQQLQASGQAWTTAQTSTASARAAALSRLQAAAATNPVAADLLTVLGITSPTSQ